MAVVLDSVDLSRGRAGGNGNGKAGVQGKLGPGTGKEKDVALEQVLVFSYTNKYLPGAAFLFIIEHLLPARSWAGGW